MSTRKFCLIGYPLKHSMSPFIHAELFKIRDLNAEYELYSFPPEKNSEEFAKLSNAFSGFNVTIPYKESVIPYLKKLEGRADVFKSVNTVKVTENGLTGYNTDCDGFIISLNKARIELKGHILILGSGGVARTFAHEAALKNCRITNVNRENSLHRSQKLKEDISKTIPNLSFESITYDQLENNPDSIEKIDLLINATPVGMYPATFKSPVSENILKKSKAVFDAIYNPRETLLLKQAKALGIKTLDGMPMLVWQAEVAQQIWFGNEVNTSLIKEIIEKSYFEMDKRF